MLLLKITTENLGQGLVYTVFGFSVVMLVLLLITFMLYIFSAIVKAAENKKVEAVISEESKEETKAEPVIVNENLPVVEASNNLVDDTELIAVITAAIAASLNTSSDKLVVRSIRKLNSWKKESIRQKNTL